VSGDLEVGFYSLGLVADADNAAVLGVIGLGKLAGVAVNATGLMPTGWFADLDNTARHIADSRATAYDTQGRGNPNDFWLRAYGEQINADLGTDNVGRVRQNQYGGSVGYDRAIGQPGAGALFAGAYAGYQVSKLNFRGTGGAKGDTDSIAGGVYLSWVRSDGWFTSATLKGQSFTVEYKSQGDKGEFDNYGLGFSLAGGKQFDLGDSWFIEPEARIDYAHFVAEDYSFGSGGDLAVRVDDTDLLRLGAGARIGKTFIVGGALLRPSVRLGAEYQVSAGGDVVAGDKFRPNVDGVRAVVGFGLQWQLGDNHQISFGYDASFGEKYNKVWSLNGGYSWRF
jgi:outer membrane autotransporter protein